MALTLAEAYRKFKRYCAIAPSGVHPPELPGGTPRRTRALGGTRRARCGSGAHRTRGWGSAARLPLVAGHA